MQLGADTLDSVTSTARKMFQGGLWAMGLVCDGFHTPHSFFFILGASTLHIRGSGYQ